MAAIIGLICSAALVIVSPERCHSWHSSLSFRITVSAAWHWQEDPDVIRERARVTGGQAETDMILLKGIRKVYAGGKVAVKDASFGIPRGECFGFLVRALSSHGRCSVTAID